MHTAPPKPPRFEGRQTSGQDIENYIRMCARKGFARATVARAMGYSKHQMVKLCSAMPDIAWPEKSNCKVRQYIEQQRRLQGFPNLQLGRAAARDAKRARDSITVRGVTGTLSELTEYFGSTVSRSRICRRLKEAGTDDERYAAFTAPASRRRSLTAIERNALKEAAMTQKPSMQAWTIYFNPSDFPGQYVTRRFDLVDGQALPSEEAYVEGAIEQARHHVPQGLVRFERMPGDEPTILECWL